MNKGKKAKKRIITVLNKNNNFISKCTVKRAYSIVSRGNAKWIDRHTIKIIYFEASSSEYKASIDLNKATCYICEQKIEATENLSVDHVYPKGLGGPNSKDNYKCCCVSCNRDKADMDLVVYVKHMRNNRENYKNISDKQLNNLYKLGVEYRNKYRKGNANETDSIPAQP